MPITSVNCERAISTYNAVKTSGRASLKVSSTSVNCERAISTYNAVKTSGRASLKVSSTSVNCERAISTYNAVKTPGRASQKVLSVQCLVSLNLEAPSVRDFPYEDAFQGWTLQKQRPGLHVIEKRAAP